MDMSNERQIAECVLWRTVQRTILPPIFPPTYDSTGLASRSVPCPVHWHWTIRAFSFDIWLKCHLLGAISLHSGQGPISMMCRSLVMGWQGLPNEPVPSTMSTWSTYKMEEAHIHTIVIINRRLFLAPPKEKSYYYSMRRGQTSKIIYIYIVWAR
jgi:hypothetical protein